MSDSSPTIPTHPVKPNPAPGKLGVRVGEDGLAVAVVAPHADQVDFCVFDGAGEEVNRWKLIKEDDVHHGFISALGAGTRYGFRAHGPWDPDKGLYFNPNKVLLDPYGFGLEGDIDLDEALFAHEVDTALYPTQYPPEISTLDSNGSLPYNVAVRPPEQSWHRPRTAWADTVIYEAHVKGLTKGLEKLPEELRGTYAGLGHPETVSYLKDLGITAVELLPVHAKMDEVFLADRGLTNYWGYSTLSFFFPEPSYATGFSRSLGPQGVIEEFRGMVHSLHEAGIEVILDVVYNHTCEGGDTGPTVSWRGLDSLLYYRRTKDQPRLMTDVTGTGNTLNFSHQRVVQMALDSLRYWHTQMGVDGFRFDLATALGRLDDGYTPFHPFLVGLASDPQLADAKMIAEPWDVGPGGWRTGQFPRPFSEWNDRYRDAARRFWLDDMRYLAAGRAVGGAHDLATRLSGSADLFSTTPCPDALPARSASSSINFITAHDGFTLADLTSYNHKHNLANLENNQDGSGNNLSWNHGVEGVVGVSMTEDLADNSGIVEDVLFTRACSRRNLLSTLLCSAGTPMIVAGDEFARTQYGNNNAYCQDNQISWVSWKLDAEAKELQAFTRYLLKLRQQHPVMRPSRFATGKCSEGDQLPDLSWLSAQNEPFSSSQWSSPDSRVLQMLRSGKPDHDCDLLVVINATLIPQNVTLATGRDGTRWARVLDTCWRTSQDGHITDAETALEQAKHFSPGTQWRAEPQSMSFFFSKEAPESDDAS